MGLKTDEADRVWMVLCEERVGWPHNWTCSVVFDSFDILNSLVENPPDSHHVLKTGGFSCALVITRPYTARSVILHTLKARFVNQVMRQAIVPISSAIEKRKI
jgi:hypothetical protein